MSNLKRKLLILFMAASLLFSACNMGGGPSSEQADSSGGDGITVEMQDGETAMGRYVETAWALPEATSYIVTAVKGPDGAIEVLSHDDAGEKQYFSTTDGGSWQELEPEWLALCNERELDVRRLSYNTKGDIAVAAYEYNEGGMPNVHIFHQPKGAAPVEVPIEVEFTGGSNLNSFMLDDEGYLIIATWGAVGAVYDLDGSLVTKLEYAGGKSAGVPGCYALLPGIHMNQGGDGSPVVESGTIAILRDGYDGLTEMLPCDFLGRFNSDVIGMREDGGIVIVNSRGIFHRLPGGSAWEKLLDGALTTLSSPLLTPQLVIPHGDDEFLVLARGDETLLLNFAFSDDTPVTPETELSIYTLRSEVSSLRQAATEFRSQRPDVYVNITGMVDMNSGITYQDAIRTINTELLAGKGPDLIMLDNSMPIQSYIDNGILADLSGLLRPMMDSGELLPNIAGTFEQDGKICAVPTKFTMPSIWGGEEAIAAATSLESLVQYAESHPGERLFLSHSPENLRLTFYESCAPAWRTADGGIDEAKLAEYLGALKRLYDLFPETELDEDTISFDGMYYVANGEAQLYYSNLMGFESIAEANGVVSSRNGVDINQDDESVSGSVPGDQLRRFFAPMPGQGGSVYIPEVVMGVNAAGPRQELAMEFLQCLLSEKVQRYEFYDGFSVNTGGIRHQTGKINRDTYEIAVGDDRFFYMYPSPEVRRAVAEVFPQLSVPFVDDYSLSATIDVESEPFFNGTKTAEEVAAKIVGQYRIQQMEKE